MVIFLLMPPKLPCALANTCHLSSLIPVTPADISSFPPKHSSLLLIFPRLPPPPPPPPRPSPPSCLSSPLVRCPAATLAHSTIHSANTYRINLTSSYYKIEFAFSLRLSLLSFSPSLPSLSLTLFLSSCPAATVHKVSLLINARYCPGLRKEFC